MERHHADSEQFSLLQHLDSLAKAGGDSITDVIVRDRLLKQISETLAAHQKHGARLHGLRSQSMFAYVAAALGQCEVISEEDAGELYFHAGDVQRPDFRIRTKASGELFVEVKNFRPNNPFEPYQLKKKYIDSLKRYCSTFGVPLKFAIYWARWRVWTLVDVESLDVSSGYCDLHFVRALELNQMNLLGDHMLAAVPPISLRLYPDETKPRRVDDHGLAAFTVKDACLSVGSERIEDKFEQQLGWFFFLHGKWSHVFRNDSLIGRNVEFIELCVEPEEDTAADDAFPCASLGFMSQMVSHQYQIETGLGGDVRNISPRSQPDAFGIDIPSDYRGNVLKLWRFMVWPKESTRDEILSSKIWPSLSPVPVE